MHCAQGGESLRVSKGSEGAKARSTPRRSKKHGGLIEQLTGQAPAAPDGRPTVQSAVAVPSFEGFSRRQQASESRVRTARRCHLLPCARVTDSSSPRSSGERRAVGAKICIALALAALEIARRSRAVVDLPRGIVRTHDPSLGSPPSTPVATRRRLLLSRP